MPHPAIRPPHAVPRTLAHLLMQHLAQLSPAAFDWRSNHCCHFAGAWWHRATGHNPLAGLPATPHQRAALRLLKAQGGLVQAVQQATGTAPLAHPLAAQMGDVVVARVGSEPAVRGDHALRLAAGIASGGGTIIFLGVHGGTVHLPLAAHTVVAAFRPTLAAACTGGQP